jgi:hypothetical protein
LENLDIFEILKFYYPLPIVYIEPLTHGILTPLPMVYRPHYPWYIDPLTHDILTPDS